MKGSEITCEFISWDFIDQNLKNAKFRCHIFIKYWMSERLVHNIITPKLVDFRLSIGSDILLITKHIDHHNFGPNLNIEKILSVLESPGHPQEAKKKTKKNTFACIIGTGG